MKTAHKPKMTPIILRNIVYIAVTAYVSWHYGQYASLGIIGMIAAIELVIVNYRIHAMTKEDE